jgi:hypothetical protein
MESIDRKEFENYMKKVLDERHELLKEKAEEFINSLDFEKLSVIKSKNISEISQQELEYLGFNKIDHEDFEEIYAYRDFDGIKIYFNRIENGFEKRGFMLKKELEIYTTTELIEHTLTNWKLKLNDEKNPFMINWDEEPPF